MNDITPYLDDGERFAIDVPRLLLTKLLIQATSGGGKSVAIRRIAEQTFGMAQHIIFDPEGEFHTLRERLGYLLVGPGGDTPASVATARLLATRLLELGTSAIIDLSDLGTRREEYVKEFLESMVASPRELWHGVIVFLDEAHKFAPERGMGDATSTEAVKDYATRGRKRGFSLVAATQRIAELHKTVTAECQNKMIGRTVMDIDIERARKMIGMNAKDAVDSLKNLEDGQFWTTGSALSRDVRLVQVGTVVTTHPRPGQQALPPTPAPAKVKQMLAQLAGLDKEAAAEAKTVDQLRARVRELEACVADSVAAPDPKWRSREAELLEQLAELDDKNADLMQIIDDLLIAARSSADRLTTAIGIAKGSITHPPRTPITIVAPEAPLNPNGGVRTPAPVRVSQGTAPRSPSPGGMSKPARAILVALAQHGPLTRKQILIHAGYKRSGDTTAAFASHLAKGYVVQEGDHLKISTAGEHALGEYRRLPVGAERRAEILGSASRVERALLAVMFDTYPGTLAREDVLGRAGYKRSGDTTAAFAKFLEIGYLVSAGGGRIHASKELFP